MPITKWQSLLERTRVTPSRHFSQATNHTLLLLIDHFSALLFTIDWKLPFMTLCSNPKEESVESSLSQKQQESGSPNTKVLFMSILVSLLLISHWPKQVPSPNPDSRDGKVGFTSFWKLQHHTEKGYHAEIEEFMTFLSITLI